MSRKTRKLMWSAPLVAVLAIAGALTMFMTAAPNGAQAQASELPGVPQNVLAVLEDWRMVKLTWDAPTGGATPTGYRVDHSTDGNRWTLLEPNLTNTEYLHNIGNHNPTRTTSNYYRVFALNGGITGPVSSDYLLDTRAATCPSPVRNLAARALGQTSVQVTWTAPVDDGGTAITGYQIIVNNGDGTRMVTVPADSGSYTHSDLMAETRYSYQVKPVTAASKAKPCAESIGATVQTTTGVQTPPSPPQHLLLAQRCLTCTDDDDTNDKRGFYLYWHQPADLGGDSALGSDSHNVQPYHVEAEISISGSARGVIKRTPVTYDNGAVERASFAEDFKYEIAYNDSGAGSGYEDMGIPLDADDDDRDRLTQIVFRVYAQTVTSDGKKLMSAPATIRHTVLSKEATNPGRTTLDLSSESESKKDRPRTHTPPKGEVEAKSDPHGNVRVTWQAPGSGGNIPISQYYIAVSTDKINWTQLNLGTRKTDPEYIHEASDVPKTGEGEKIYYRVAAQNAQFLGVAKKSDGIVAMAAEIDPKKPGCVTNLRAVAGENQVELTWGPPADIGSHPLTGYDIYRRAGGTAVVGEANKLNDEKVSPDTTSYTDDGPNDDGINMPGETLYYKVVADSAATSDDSCTTVEQFVVMPEETLNAPQGLTAEDAKDSSSSSPQDRGVLLLWTQEQTTAASAVIGYRVDRRINGGRWVTLTSRSNNNHTDWTDPDEPAAGEQRHYRVAAVSFERTLGPWAIIDYPQLQDQPQDLGAPTNVMATVDDSDPGSTSVTVTWTNGVNADRHIAVLFDANWEFHPSHIGTAQTDGMVTFENVQPGAYTAVVLSIEDNNQGNAVNFEYDIASVTVGAGN